MSDKELEEHLSKYFSSTRPSEVVAKQADKVEKTTVKRQRKEDSMARFLKAAEQLGLGDLVK